MDQRGFYANRSNAQSILTMASGEGACLFFLMLRKRCRSPAKAAMLSTDILGGLAAPEVSAENFWVLVSLVLLASVGVRSCDKHDCLIGEGGQSVDCLTMSICRYDEGLG